MKRILILITVILFFQLVNSAFDGVLYNFEDVKEFSVTYSEHTPNNFIDRFPVSIAVLLAQIPVQKYEYDEYEFESMNISIHDYLYYPLPNAPPAPAV
jgi:hypothetical protein